MSSSSYFSKTGNSYHPNSQGLYGVSSSVVAGNNITIRANEIPEGIPSQHPSRNILQAHFKALRLFRKACRLMPFILRIHNLNRFQQFRVSPIQAQLNLAQAFRDKGHLRDPRLVDSHVTKGYEFLVEAEWQYTNTSYILQWVAPNNYFSTDRGYSYLDEKKFANKSKFLKDFYLGQKPGAY